MKKKKLSPLWLIPAVVIVALILWCIHFPLTRIAGFSKSVEPLHATVFFDQVPETPMLPMIPNSSVSLQNSCGVCEGGLWGGLPLSPTTKIPCCI